MRDLSSDLPSDLPSDAATGDRSLPARTLRKVIIRIVPFVMAMYFVNYLDRTNLGIAKTDISEHLQLSATMFGLASGIFFIGYVLVEVPSNLALNRFGARRWLARIAVSWGIVAMAIGFAPNAPTLLVLRFLLGVAEAGLFPGVIFYLSRWFPRDHRARVVALFMIASPVAAAIGTPVSAWLIHVGDGLFGLAGWQFMMICVGVPAVLLGVMCWFYLTDHPGDATWLHSRRTALARRGSGRGGARGQQQLRVPVAARADQPSGLGAGTCLLRHRLRALRTGILSAVDHLRVQEDLRR